MQSVSAELAAECTGQGRQPRDPVVRLKVDWARNGYGADGSTDDLTADVVSVDLTHDLATDIPAECKLFAGAAAAEATVTLATKDPAGDPAKHGAWKYSGLNSASPLFGFKRKGAPAWLEMGFVGSGGPEYVTVLEGYVRSLNVISGGRYAVLRIVDRSETFRRQVSVPLIVADGETETGTGLRVGLNTIFVADWIARACGWYASPPPRADCLFSATMHGSAHPEIGQAQDIHGSNQSLPNFAPSPPATAAAKWVQALHLVGSSATTISYILSTAAGTTSTNNGDEQLFEGWVKLQSTSVDQPLFIAFVTGQATPYVSLFWQQSSGRLVATFDRGGADTDHATAAGPVVSPGTSAFHYYGVHVAWTSTGADVTFRYDATSTDPEHVSTSSFTGQPALNTIRIGNGKVSSFADGDLNALVEAVQFTREATAGSWNNAFTPTAQLHASAAIDSRIAATPHSTEEGWGLLQQVAQAEFATTGFDEVGMFHYWPRDRWTTAPYDTSQRTLTPSTALKELETVEAVDQVRNHITAKVNSPVVEGSSTVWKLGQRLKIDASGSRTLWASLPNPTANIDTSMTYGVTAGTGSRYAAGTNRDGTGTQVLNLTWTVTVLSPTSVKMVVSNAANAFDVWLTVDANLSAGLAGVAYVWLDGQQVLFSQSGTGGAMLVEAEDATSQTDYGVQLLELPDSEFRQDIDQVTGIVADLLLALKQAGPVLSEVPAVGDPRIQLGDRLTITDVEGLGFSADFHVSRLDLTLDGEGLGMALNLRSA